MSSNFDSLFMLCKNEVASDRLVRKLSTGVAPNALSIDPKYPILFHCWVEEQVKIFAKHTIHTGSPQGPLRSSGSAESTVETEEVKRDRIADLPSTEIGTEESVDDLKNLTFGGLKIGVKVKQQKKRMKPNLVNDKPNVHAVQGNINSLGSHNEITDIRKELKSMGTNAIPLGSIEKDNNFIRKLSVPLAPSTVAGVVVPEKVNVPTTSCGLHCPDCAKFEDIDSILRVTSIYSTLVLCQYIPLAKVLPVVQQVTSLDPEACAEMSIPLCRRARESTVEGVHDTFLINANCVKAFLRSLLGALYPLLTCCGSLIASEIADSLVVRTWAPELAVKIKELSAAQASEHASFAGLGSGGANFRLPETFQKPFREDLDSKNEYKTQTELATFYERERTYDELSNLFLRYQVTNRSDLDGSAAKTFFRTDMLKTGLVILNLKDPNYLWFAELFMKLLLFHGVNTAPLIPSSTSVATGPTSTTAIAIGLATGSGTQSPFSSPAVTTTSTSASASNNATSAAAAFGASPSRGTAFERTLSAAASPGRKKLQPSQVVTPASTPSSSSSGLKSSLNANYSANFPGLSAVKNVPLDASKQRQLEERLGMGGDVKANLFAAPHTTHTAPVTAKKIFTPRAATASTAAGANSGGIGGVGGGGAGGSGGYKGRTPSARTNPTAVSTTPTVNVNAPDPYESAALHFAGAEKFFFRFIVSMNNFRFNQGLMTCILAEIDELARNETFDATFATMNMDTGTPTKSSKLPIFLPSDQNSAKHDGSGEVFIAPEEFALKVAKLKILGRFLGLLHFYHQWVPSGSGESGPLHTLATELTSKRGALQLSLPVLQVVQEAHGEGRLSLALPWVVEFLKMLTWDPVCSSPARARGEKSALVADKRRIPYFDVLERLRSIQHGEQLKANGKALSCNRVYCLMEIQNLWIALPASITSVVDMCEVIIESSPSRQHLRSRDSPWNLSEASPVDFLASSQDSSTLDDQHLAFSAVFLRHVVPFLEPVYLAWKSSRLAGYATSSLRTRVAGAAKKIKRQTPSVITAESMALMEALSRPPVSNDSSLVAPPPPPSVPASSPKATSSFARAATAPSAVMATPTKAARSVSSSSESLSNTAKSPRKKINPESIGGGNIIVNIGDMKSPVRKPDRSRNTSFESLSPPLLGLGGAFGAGTGDRGASRSNSITTSGRSSPAGLSGTSRRQRSLSDLNNHPFVIRQPSLSSSPSPLKALGLSSVSPLKLSEYSSAGSDGSDIMERLEISFWSDHPTLQTMSKFLLAHCYQACLEHVKDLVGSAVRELIASLSSIRGEPDRRRYGDLLETYSKRAQYEAVSEGEQFVETFFGSFCEKTLPDMCQLYPANERVVKMAVYYMNRHLAACKTPLCAYLKSYCAKKMGELRELSIKQHLRQQGEATAAATAAAGVDYKAEIQATAASDAKKSRCLEQIRELAQSLCDFIIIDGNPARSSTTWLEESDLTCRVVTGSLTRDQSDAQLASVTVIVRNNTALLLSLLLELTGQISAFASTLVSAGRDGQLNIAPDLSATLSFNLKTALTNLTSVFMCCTKALAETVKQEFASLSDTARGEIEGKIAADVAKFLTSMVPHLLYLDLIYAALCKPGVISAAHALALYSTQRAAKTGEQGNLTEALLLLPLPSDLLHFLVSHRLMSLDMLSRTLTLTARAKTAAFHENCKGLVGIAKCVNHALLCAIGRLLILRQDVLGLDMSVLEDGGWYKDSTIRLLVKSNLSEPLSNLISVLLVNL